jgi:hypothetical protein
LATTTGSEITSFLKNDDVQALVERNRKNGWEDLEAFQRAFAYSFLTHYNHRRAAKEAGRSPDSGLAILRHPLVDAFIQDQQQQLAQNSFITKDYITTQYLNMIPLLTGEEDVPTILANGETVYGKQFRPAELRGVLQELSKTVDGYNKEKASGGGKGGVQVNIDLSSLVGNTSNYDNNNIMADGKIGITIDGSLEGDEDE